jgi:hypothetical protein
MRVVVVRDAPRYQLPEDLPLPSGFREDPNAWALEFLGIQKPLLPDGQALTVDNTVYMNPRTYEAMKAKLGVE